MEPWLLHSITSALHTSRLQTPSDVLSLEGSPERLAFTLRKPNSSPHLSRSVPSLAQCFNARILSRERLKTWMWSRLSRPAKSTKQLLRARSCAGQYQIRQQHRQSWACSAADDAKPQTQGCIVLSFGVMPVWCCFLLVTNPSMCESPYWHQQGHMRRQTLSRPFRRPPRRLRRQTLCRPFSHLRRQNLRRSFRHLRRKTLRRPPRHLRRQSLRRPPRHLRRQTLRRPFRHMRC